MDQVSIERVADLFFQARKTGVRISALPMDLRPPSMADVQAIIDAVDRRIPEPIAGWKLHAKPGKEACYAPLYASRIFESPARVPIALAQTLAVEAEICFRVVRDLPPRKEDYAESEVFSAVEACVAFEVVDSRFVNLKELVQTSRLYEVYADHMANGAFVFADFRSDWQNLVDFTKVHVSMQNGETFVADQIGGHPNGNPANALVLFANIMREQKGLKVGHYLATGSFTSFRIVEANRATVARFDGFGEALCTIVK